MKKQFLNLAAVASLSIGMVACGNNGNDTAMNDTTATTTAETTTATSSGSYAAMADTVEQNSSQGYYLNPKTGKPYGKLTVDRNNGRVTTEAGEPVYRYVDNRNWWVYGYDPTSSNWTQVGEARMQGNELQYKGDGDNWVDYDTRWKKDDGIINDQWKKETDSSKTKVEEDGDMKMKTDDGTKIKSEDGELKIKTKDKKIKVDEDGVKTEKN